MLTNYSMKSTLLMAFNPGAYGTYLEWVLNTLLTNDEIQSPFRRFGNSHNSKLGHHLFNLDGFRNYLASGDEFKTARLHPKTEAHHSLKQNLEFLASHARPVILLYPDRKHELMCTCNYMTKVRQNDPYDGNMAYINPQDIYQGYGIEPGTDLKTIPNWIRREHMSFCLFDSWHDLVEWYFPDCWNDPRVMIVTTKELFENFVGVMARIETFWGVTYHRDIADMLPWHNKMISLQTNLGKDRLCADIIEAAVNGTSSHFEFGQLCLTSEAWIQHQLRLRGYEIRCHDLNVFPQDTESLRSLVYESG